MRLFNLVRFASSTTGTGDIAVGSAITGFSTLAAAGASDGDMVPYVIEDAAGGKAWGVGTYSTTGPTLVRDANETRLVSGVRASAKLDIQTSCEVYVSGAEGVLQRQPRVNSQASASSITPDVGAYDAYDLYAQAAGLNINNVTGTPYDFQRLIVRIADNGSEQSIAWGDGYRSIYGSGLPVVTIPGTILRIVLEYSSLAGAFVCIDVQISNISLPSIELVGAGFFPFQGQTSGTFTCDLTTIFTGESALQEDDIVVVGAHIAHDNGILTTDRMNSSGWTVVAGPLATTDSRRVSAYVYRKLMGSTPDTSIVFDHSNSTAAAFLVMVRAYRNVDVSTPLDVSTTTVASNDTHRPNPPANTPATSGSVSVVFGFGVSASARNYTSSDLDDFVESEAMDTYWALGGMGHKEVSSEFDPAQFGSDGDFTFDSCAAAHLILRAA